MNSSAPYWPHWAAFTIFKSMSTPFPPNFPERPNIIWIFGDQHRASALSCNGDRNVSTPNIDRMAVEGIHFPNAVAGFPLCCPYRGALLSGRYPHHCIPGHEHPFPDNMPTIARPFNEAGYETAYFGKWHIDGFKESNGRAAFHTVPKHRRGEFRTWIGYENNNSQFDCWVHGHAADGSDVPHYRLPEYETDALTEMFLEFLEDRVDADDAGKATTNEPFFAVLSVQPPHSPNMAPPEWMDRQKPGEIKLRPNVPPCDSVLDQARVDLAGYYAQIENLDWNVGRVLQLLMDTGLRENTYVFFFSDHGDMMGSHGHFAKNSPYEESIRVPMFVSPPTPCYARPNRGLSDAVINHVDMAPTSLGLAGIDVPDYMEGTNYAWHINFKGDPENEPDSAYIQQVIPTGHGPSPDRPWRGVVTRDGWKYACLEGQPWMLFDLNDDPYELRNLALYAHAKDKRRELHEKLKQWIERTGDEFELPEIWLPQWGE
jgi:arylsulfatase A-like enzyme